MDECLEMAVVEMDETPVAMEPAAPTERDNTGRFVKGHRKLANSGSVKGKPTKFSFDVRRVLEEYGCNPLIVMLDIVYKGELPLMPGENPKKRERASTDERIRAAKELLAYTYPKLSATQITGRDGGPIATAHLDVTQLMTSPELVEHAQALSLALTAARGNEESAIRDEDTEQPHDARLKLARINDDL